MVKLSGMTTGDYRALRDETIATLSDSALLEGATRLYASPDAGQDSLLVASWLAEELRRRRPEVAALQDSILTDPVYGGTYGDALLEAVRAIRADVASTD